jgi:hypothetical protein
MNQAAIRWFSMLQLPRSRNVIAFYPVKLLRTSIPGTPKHRRSRGKSSNRSYGRIAASLGVSGAGGRK